MAPRTQQAWFLARWIEQFKIHWTGPMPFGKQLVLILSAFALYMTFFNLTQFESTFEAGADVDGVLDEHFPALETHADRVSFVVGAPWSKSDNYAILVEGLTLHSASTRIVEIDEETRKLLRDCFITSFVDVPTQLAECIAYKPEVADEFVEFVAEHVLSPSDGVQHLYVHGLDLALTIPVWERLVRHVAHVDFVLVYRHPLWSALDMERGQVSSAEKAVAQWDTFNRQALQHVDDHHTLFVEWDNLVAHWPHALEAVATQVLGPHAHELLEDGAVEGVAKEIESEVFEGVAGDVGDSPEWLLPEHTELYSLLLSNSKHQGVVG